jgi:hypothetical protein
MTGETYRPNAMKLLLLMIPASAYLGWLAYSPKLTGNTLVDGSLGVLMGLYICAQPAANGIDLIFLQRGAFKRISSEWGGLRWLALNMFVMIVGWFVIVIGVTQFTSMIPTDAP